MSEAGGAFRIAEGTWRSDAGSRIDWSNRVDQERHHEGVARRLCPCLYFCLCNRSGCPDLFIAGAVSGFTTGSKVHGTVFSRSASRTGQRRESGRGLFGDVHVSEGRRICAVDRRRGSSTDGICFAIWGWRERQGRVSRPVLQDGQTRREQAELYDRDRPRRVVRFQGHGGAWRREESRGRSLLRAQGNADPEFDGREQEGKFEHPKRGFQDVSAGGRAGARGEKLVTDHASLKRSSGRRGSARGSGGLELFSW